jgi:predicted AAA+ superfamily ATPase
LQPGTYAYGRAFEHFVVVEALRLSDYRQNDFRFSYLRTKDGVEVDLIVERPGAPMALLEIKSSDRIDTRDTRSLERLAADIPGAEAFCVSRDQTARRIGTVNALPWQRTLAELGL